MLPYLPNAQFKGQLRELVAIMHDWRDKGTTNHLLINRVMDYPKSEIKIYFEVYANIYNQRYKKHISKKYYNEFENFAKGSSTLMPINAELFDGWHNKEYLRICVYNIYEKYKYGLGKSKVTEKEWNRVLEGYKIATKEDWEI